MEGFDPDNIIQFGMNFQWARIALIWTDLQPEVFYHADTDTVVFPESWRTGSEWLQDGIWESHFIPNATYDGSELLGGNAFSTGNLAMAVAPLWYTCCLGNSVDNFEWDMGVVPRSFDGEYHVATDADTFRLTKGSQNPEAAFTVLSYLLTEGAKTLSVTYGGYPAHPDYQQIWVDAKDAQFNWGINWALATESLAYNNPGNMHHEQWLPNWQKATDRIDAFNSLLSGDTGGDIDVQAELDTLEAEVNTIIHE
jgi:multiple sugar transport system substrate-binding protein